MAVAESFFFNGEWVKIHVDVVKEHDRSFYSITARDECNHLLNGFEYRVETVIDSDARLIMKTPYIERLVKQARDDIENHYWEKYVESLAGLENLYKFSSPYEEGREAYKTKQNHNTVPYPDESEQAYKWLEGWADEHEKTPQHYNDVTGEFENC